MTIRDEGNDTNFTVGDRLAHYGISLDELIYDWPQAFGRFALSGMNCGMGALTEEQIAGLAKALRCSIVVVHRHI